MVVVGRSKRKITYHGRSGYPVIHKGSRGGKYIMVRKKGGGTKKMYLSDPRVKISKG